MKPGTPPVPSLWVMLWQVVGIDTSAATDVWARVWQSTDPHVQAWRYSIDRYNRLVDCGVGETIADEFLHGPWRGKNVIDALERLAIDQILPRKKVNALEEIFLRQMNEQGGWRFRRVEPAP